MSQIPPKGQPVRKYLEMLEQEGFISLEEGRVLSNAVELLESVVPFVSIRCVDEVRYEMASPENNRYVLRNREEEIWKRAISNGETPVEGFDFNMAYRNFLVTPEADRGRSLLFLHKCDAERVEPYVPSYLAQAEVFFFIVLRIYRRQVELDKVHWQGVTQPPSLLLAEADTRTQSGIWRVFRGWFRPRQRGV